MIFGIYSMRDNKTGFMSLTTEQNDACAVRNFEHAMQNTGSLLYSHPEDFDLYNLGTFDTKSGVIVANDPPQHVVSGASLFVKGE